MHYWTFARSIDGADHIGATFCNLAPRRAPRPGLIVRILRALFVSL